MELMPTNFSYSGVKKLTSRLSVSWWSIRHTNTKPGRPFPPGKLRDGSGGCGRCRNGEPLEWSEIRSFRVEPRIPIRLNGKRRSH